MNKKFTAAGAGIALAVFAALPASATSVTVDGIDWSFGSYSLDAAGGGGNLVNGARGLDDTSFTMTLHGGDNALYDTYSCNSETTTTQGDGDVDVTCDSSSTATVTGLTWVGSSTVFSGDFAGEVARQVFTVTNETSSAIVVDYEYHVDTEECNNGDGMVGTQSGDLTSETVDQWLACNNDNDTIEAIAYGVGQNATDTSLLDDPAAVATDFLDSEVADDLFFWNAEGLSIAAGETVNFVYFYRAVGGTEHGATAEGAESDDTYNTFMSTHFDDTAALLEDSRLFENVEGTVVNWVAAAEPEIPLAETGVDATGIALGGIAALVAGVGIYAVRRRARA